MKPTEILLTTWLAFAVLCPDGLAQSASPEIIDITKEPRLTIRSGLGVTNVIEYAEALGTNQWLVLTNLLVTNNPYVVVDPAAPTSQRFYRVVIPVPPGMALIPAGSFTMGNTFNEGDTDDRPTHTVELTAYYMDKTEVTKALWDEVHTWAVAHGYAFDNAGSGKAANHPVQSVNWYDALKWCNARSEKEGRAPAYYTNAAQTAVYRTGQVRVQNEGVKWNSGYRLPTEAEWEKAARGGASGHRFPWSNADTITQSQANYFSYWSDGKPFYDYDLNPTEGYHPSYDNDPMPYTSPVGSFPSGVNGYGLYDMAGNVWEWCWDWWDGSYYSSSPGSDPRGPASGSVRVDRGGSWRSRPDGCRVAFRDGGWPDSTSINVGFRSVLAPGQ